MAVQKKITADVIVKAFGASGVTIEGVPISNGVIPSANSSGETIYAESGTEFNANNGMIQTKTLTGNLAPTFSNIPDGKALTLILTASGATRTVTVPSGHVAVSSTFTIADTKIREFSILRRGSTYDWTVGPEKITV